EDVSECVGEYERAGHERDTEHDRERCERQSELLGEEPGDRDLPHGAVSYDSTRSGRYSGWSLRYCDATRLLSSFNGRGSGPPPGLPLNVSQHGAHHAATPGRAVNALAEPR